MRVVIVGVGDIGRDLAENLARRRSNELVLIDLDEARCEHLAGELDVLVLHGDGANPEILKKAQLAEADALVATTGSDAINTVIAILGRDMGVKNIMVKLNESGLRAACREIGVSKIITPKISAAASILGALYGFDRLDFSLVVHGGMQMVELVMREGYGQRLSELEMPEGALVISVLRGREVLFPSEQTKVEKDDTLLTLIKDQETAEKVSKLYGN